jgi:hypothetical protein
MAIIVLLGKIPLGGIFPRTMANIFFLRNPFGRDSQKRIYRYYHGYYHPLLKNPLGGGFQEGLYLPLVLLGHLGYLPLVLQVPLQPRYDSPWKGSVCGTSGNRTFEA